MSLDTFLEVTDSTRGRVYDVMRFCNLERNRYSTIRYPLCDPVLARGLSLPSSIHYGYIALTIKEIVIFEKLLKVEE